MDRGRRNIGVTLIVLLLLSMGSRPANAEPLPSAIVSRDADTIAHGKRLFAQNCSPCHGQQGVGENPATPMGGWNPQVGPVAPALDGTGHAWHHEPEYLFQTVRNGSTVQGSRMRGWHATMSDYDILAVIAYFQSLWPPRLQEAYTHRYLHRVVREPMQPRATGMAAPQRTIDLVPIGMLASLWGPTEDMLAARDALQALGYHQNQQVAFGWRAAEGHEGELEAIATQLLRDGAQLFYASDLKALAAVQRVNSNTPIVFTTWYNPGVASLGEHVRGVIPAFPEGSPKSLEMFRVLLPSLKRVLLPYDADDPELVELLPALRAMASRLGITLVERAVRTQAEAQQVIMGARKEEVDAILPVGGRWNIAGYALQACVQHHMPALFSRGWMAEYGGLVSYGPSWYGLGQHTARVIADLLRGATPAGPPLQVSQEMELVINLRTAQALGITVPPSLLSQATRVIR
jgi:putative tryptophan/tyrosine transport system substrate-binding protein